jgi:hypothetical protein
VDEKRKVWLVSITVSFTGPAVASQELKAILYEILTEAVNVISFIKSRH